MDGELRIQMQGPVTVLLENSVLTIKWVQPPAAAEPTRRAPARAEAAPPAPTLPAEVIAQARELRAQGLDWETVVSTLYTWTPTRRGHRKSDPTPLDHRAGAIYQHRLSQLQAVLGEAPDPATGEEASA